MIVPPSQSQTPTPPLPLGARKRDCANSPAIVMMGLCMNDPRQHDSYDATFLAGGGEMGARMHALDWRQTPLGPVSDWPQSLRTAISICLNSRFPMVLWRGFHRLH